jgi:hypothetical protein
MAWEAKRRIKSSTANAPSPKADAAARPKTDRSKNSSSWLRRSTPDDVHVQTPRFGPLSLSQQTSSEKQEDLTDSTEFLGLSDEDDPDPEILDHFLRSGTDPSCPMSVQRGRLWKAKTEALRRVNALLGENEDLLQSDPQVSALPSSTPMSTLYALIHRTSYPNASTVVFAWPSPRACAQWRKQDAQTIKDDIRAYMDMHEDTARWLAEPEGKGREEGRKGLGESMYPLYLKTPECLVPESPINQPNRGLTLRPSPPASKPRNCSASGSGSTSALARPSWRISRCYRGRG